MEQKRVLWIVAAVGLFLLVVIGTALLISSPSKNSQPSLSTLQGGNSWILSDGVISSSSTVAKQTETVVDLNNLNKANYTPSVSNAVNGESNQNAAPAADAEVKANTGSSTPAQDSYATASGISQTAVTLNLNITPSSSSASSYSVQPAQTGSTAQTAPAETKTASSTASAADSSSKTSASSSAKTSSADTSKTLSSSTEKTTSQAANTSTQTSKTTTQAVATSSASATTASTSSKTTSTKAVPVAEPDNYWVQVASFTGKTNAEEARSALAAQKIAAEVFTYQDAKGTIYYRLRVGPYTTKSEAEYWNKIILETEGIAGNDTYVVNSTVH